MISDFGMDELPSMPGEHGFGLASAPEQARELDGEAPTSSEPPTVVLNWTAALKEYTQALWPG
jgi:hypothetical protein